MSEVAKADHGTTRVVVPDGGSVLIVGRVPRHRVVGALPYVGALGSAPVFPFGEEKRLAGDRIVLAGSHTPILPRFHRKLSEMAFPVPLVSSVGFMGKETKE